MNDPRPYIVIVKTPSPQEEGIVHEHVDAYDIADAMMRAAVRLSARGLRALEVLDVMPDTDEVNRRRVEHQTTIAEALAHSIRGTMAAFQQKKS